jgi:hypothetical protein
MSQVPDQSTFFLSGQHNLPGSLRTLMMQWVEVVMPKMYISDSAIPWMKKWGAKGVMFGEDVPKGTIVGLYCGPPCGSGPWQAI